jgi:hypothetical protein
MGIYKALTNIIKRRINIFLCNLDFYDIQAETKANVFNAFGLQ